MTIIEMCGIFIEKGAYGYFYNHRLGMFGFIAGERGAELDLLLVVIVFFFDQSVMQCFFQTPIDGSGADSSTRGDFLSTKDQDKNVINLCQRGDPLLDRRARCRVSF